MAVLHLLCASHCGSVVEKPPDKAGDASDPWAGKVSWRRKWQPTPVFLPGKSHGQRSLVAVVHEVTKEWDMTELNDTHCS